MKYIIPIFSLLFFANIANGHGGNGCSLSRKQQKAPMGKNTSATVEEDYYDVKYVKYDLELTNTSTAITGHVTTKAVTTIAGFNLYAFELNNQITIDSIFIDGQKLSPTSNGSIRKVNLPTTLPQNTIFTADVYYHGQPTAGTGFFTRGINLQTQSGGTSVLYTMSDMYTAEDWWPSKQNILDKIDSVDVWVTVASNLKAGSNGLLKAVTPVSGGKSRYEWAHRYPIDYYLVSVTVAPYSDYSYYMHFTDGSNDSMLIQNFVYDSLNYMTPVRKAALDSTGYIVDYFSKLFGKYPFYKEKYGHCIVETLGGGMEHQTMTTLAYASPTLIAHELGHQWWGNHVTYGSWRDIWLSEGFASYTEQLFVEHFYGIADAKAYRTGVFNKVVNGSGGSVYVDDTTNASRVFDSRLTYNKGAAVTHMLRYMAPQDELFFTLLKNYQQQFANNNALTSDLHRIAEQVYNIDLDTFFDQWIYKQGYPTYAGKWYQAGDKVYFQIEQTTSMPASVSVFSMPIEVKLKSVAGDTVVKVYNNQAKQSYSLVWGNTLTGIEIDPNNHVVNKSGLIKKDPLLAVEELSNAVITIYPNPAADGWHVNDIQAGATLRLTDASGKIVWTGNAQKNVWIPAKHLACGVYILTVQLAGNKSQYKLAK